MSRLHMTKKHILGSVLGLALFVIALVVLYSPFWGVPSIDDWVYAYTVRSMVESGTWDVPILSNPLAIPQIITGIILSKFLGGFHYYTLQGIGMICLLALGGMTLKTVFESGLTYWHALLISITVITSPAVFLLGQTFMTDLPFLCFFSAAILVFPRQHQPVRLGLFLVLASLAYWTRQFGLVLFPAAIFVLLAQANANSRISALNVFLFGGALLVLTSFIQSRAIAKGLPYAINLSISWERLSASPKDWIQSVYRRIGGLGVYVGIFLIPLLPALVPSVRREHSRIWLYSLCLSIIGAYLILPAEPFSPFRGNMFYLLGMGPMTLPDTFSLHLNAPVDQQSFWAFCLIFLSLFCFFLVLYRLAISWKQVAFPGRNIFVGIALLYLLTLFLPGTFFDRYVLPFWWILVILVAPSLQFSRVRTVLTAGFVILIALFSMVATSDYLKWQNTRWAMQSEANSMGILPDVIDGGYEMNGWLGNDILGSVRVGYDIHNPGFRPYVISFSRIPNMEVMLTRPTQSMLLSSPDSLFLLKRSMSSGE